MVGVLRECRYTDMKSVSASNLLTRDSDRSTVKLGPFFVLSISCSRLPSSSGAKRSDSESFLRNSSLSMSLHYAGARSVRWTVKGEWYRLDASIEPRKDKDMRGRSAFPGL
jgi:hypothetical protein